MNKKWKAFLSGCTALGVMASLSGCKEAVLIHSKGMIGRDERDLIYTALLLMLLLGNTEHPIQVRVMNQIGITAIKLRLPFGVFRF